MNRREVLKAVLGLGAVVANRGIIGDLLGKSKEIEADNVDPLLPVENEDPFWEEKCMEMSEPCTLEVSFDDGKSWKDLGSKVTNVSITYSIEQYPPGGWTTHSMLDDLMTKHEVS